MQWVVIDLECVTLFLIQPLTAGMTEKRSELCTSVDSTAAKGRGERLMAASIKARSLPLAHLHRSAACYMLV